MRKIIAFLICVGCVLGARADHITGGEMYYTAGGFSGGEYQYNVTLKLFMRCNSGRFFSDPTIISIFDRVTGAKIKDITAPLGNQENINLVNTNPCIGNPPMVCYEVGYFYFKVSLPASANGYVMASQVNYRVSGINNLGGYNQLGATYTAEIPGIEVGVTDAPANSSARFTGSDLVVICEDNTFTYSFGATDPDGDQLKYSFCNAYAGGNGGTPGNSQPASAPPYVSVPYGFPNFNGSSPLGGRVQINASTGLITGIGPAEGKYVVTVCVEEIRNGVLIAIQRKDLQLNIASCTVAAAILEQQYSLCRNSTSITLENLSTSPLIKTYEWQFLNSSGSIIFNSTLPTPTYNFPDTGLYSVKLIINKNDLCSDSSSAPVKVYPGFKPQFTYTGICINHPTVFTDASTSVYGTVNSWNWDFGEPSNFDEFSVLPGDSYTYPGMGIKNVRLIVTDSKGCIDTIFREIPIVDKPPINLAFRDSLICISDKVNLQANGSGNFTWTPLVNIINPATASPTVSPAASTVYFVDLDDNGCKNRDSVFIRVVDHVSLLAMPDTVICRTDSIRLHIVSDAVRYSWTPAAQFINPGLPNPIAITNASTLYEVTASIGSCSIKDQVLVTTVPYPVAQAGADTVICFNTSAQLNGNTDGTSFLWTPSNSLSNAAILNPLAKPRGTTAYVLMANDNRGCPKPGLDTVVVKMLAPVNAYAGHDTSVVTGEPLQLNAVGGIKYLWVPAGNLSNANIANPVAVFTQASTSIQYKVLVYNEANCSNSALVNVKVYNTKPSVFVPNAFTPNGDYKNDFLRPIAVGIEHIEYFNVYNRWGQLVFSYKDLESGGWNGRLAGKEQPADAYVWAVKAIDYTGKVFTAKGTVLLIR
ncbi:MAG: T9SS type B sorting domain-containing protein [Chitinophagaceae bacterium]